MFCFYPQSESSRKCPRSTSSPRPRECDTSLNACFYDLATPVDYDDSPTFDEDDELQEVSVRSYTSIKCYIYVFKYHQSATSVTTALSQ